MEDKRKSIIQNILIFVFVFTLVRYVFTNIFGVAVVSGSSMLPTYHNGQIVLFTRTEDISFGDVIIADTQEKYVIKRVIALTGDTVNLVGNKVIINGFVIDESDYISQETATVAQTVEMPHTVSKNSYFVLGDNRIVSHDSRFTEVGDIPKSQIKGKVILSLTK